MKTLKQFIEATHLEEKLVRAVVRQIGGWDSFKEDAEDITRGGADAGWHGFTYYNDTTAFYHSNRASILKMARDLADELGEGLIEMIKGFNCLSDVTDEEVGATLFGSKSKHDVHVANALAWFALEEVARSYVDLSGE